MDPRATHKARQAAHWYVSSLLPVLMLALGAGGAQHWRSSALEELGAGGARRWRSSTLQQYCQAGLHLCSQIAWSTSTRSVADSPVLPYRGILAPHRPSKLVFGACSDALSDTSPDARSDACSDADSC
ncbi:hypothetical protein FN846DRAFT_893499 [Sphaerosporella brunnea]|uniref:Uncharacterized protein n=1 Tax=Sphaerosporella brunnea TaxID=1250544 RepID=A0A5J5EKK4_9PEZI|nr:hypothetical protein FN846DRAFT_893499 [Sphaerosporella brunnea]